jgi:ankyrin repeat protein
MSRFRIMPTRTALHLCCQAPVADDVSTQIAELLLKDHPDEVNQPMERRGYSPLRFAVEASKPSLCKLLIEKGANVNSRAKHGSTALHHLAYNIRIGEDSREAMTRLILHTGMAELDVQVSEDKLTILGLAVGRNFRDVVDLVLEFGAHPNVEHHHQSIVYIAVAKDKDRSFPLLRAVLQHQGSNTTFQDVRSGMTALHIASLRKSVTALEILLQYDPSLSVNARTKRKETTLHVALKYSLADADEEPDDGQTVQVVDFLIQHGVDLKALDSDGNTALQLSSMYRMDDIIRSLLKANDGVDLQSVKRRDPLSLYLRHNKWTRKEFRRPARATTLAALCCHCKDQIDPQLRHLVLDIVRASC